MTPISSPCSNKYSAVHNSGSRKVKDLQYVVIHSEEADTAESTAVWFSNPHCSASTQLAIDDNICFRTLADQLIPWGAPPLNLHGLHVEQAGYARWPKWRWMRHINTIKRTAYRTAYWCWSYNIPARFLSVNQLKELGMSPGVGKGGITSHRNVSLAFGESDHMDPGTGYPYTTFMFFVKYYLRKMKK